MTLKASSLRAIIGAGLTIAMLVALYFFKESTLNTLVYFIIVILAALAAGALTNFIPGQVTYRQQDGGKSIFANEGRFVFLFVVCGGAWFYLNTNQTFDFVVYIRGKNGETILKNQEKVQVLLNNTPRLEKIDQYGRIVITGVPAELKETAVPMELMDSDDWNFDNSLKTDTFLLVGKNATLTIIHSKAVCCITGKVTSDGKVQAGVSIWVEQARSVLTDSIGHFVIELPPPHADHGKHSGLRPKTKWRACFGTRIPPSTNFHCFAMIKVLTKLVLLMCCVYSYGYPQHPCSIRHAGKILLDNKRGSGAPNITVVIGTNQGETTDRNGVFHYSLKKCPGQDVQIGLSGNKYGIVNHIETFSYTIRENPPAGIQFLIFVAPLSNLYQARVSYYSETAGLALDRQQDNLRKSIESLQKQLHKEKNKSVVLVDSLATLHSLLAKASYNHETGAKETEQLASMFASLNEVDKAYQKAFVLFERGQLKDALALLSDSKMEEEKNLILKRQEILKRDLDLYVSKCMFKGLIYENQVQLDSAEYWYKEAISSDSTKADNLIILADYLYDISRPNEPEYWYLKTLSFKLSEYQKAMTLNKLGIFYKGNNRPQEAEKAYLQAKKIFESLAKTNPAQYQADLAIIQNNLGIFYADNNQAQEAEKAFLQVKDIYEPLANTNPKQYQPFLANSLNNLGNFYSDNAPQEAEKAYLQAKEIRESLANTNPAQYQPDLASTLNNLGVFYADNKRPQEAEKAYLQAKEIRESLANTNPAQYQPDLASTLNNLGNFYKNNKRPQEAENAYLQAKEIRESLVNTNPAQYQPGLSTTLHNLGNFYLDNKRPEEAEGAYLQSKKIRESLANTNPAQYEPDLAAALNSLGNFYSNNKRPQEAEKAYLRARKIYEPFAKTNPTKYQPALSITLRNLGNFYLDNNRRQEAEEAYLLVKEICQSLVKNNSEKYQSWLTSIEDNLNKLYLNSNSLQKK